jgi:2-polyprenyl-3-methyl-5-hydroxy-6-metoxy-1,4-benzoquinol methylase
MLITEAYRKELQKIHRKDAEWGSGPRGNIIKICHFIYYNDVKRILDYGCGKGELLGWFLPIQVANYDPAITQWAADPTPQDYLLCTDVLEHVEPKCIEDVVEHLVSKFKKRAFITIALQEARITLPSGRNAHLIIKPSTWIKGNKMGFAGLKKEKDRASVILYLNQNSDNPKSLP